MPDKKGPTDRELVALVREAGDAILAIEDVLHKHGAGEEMGEEVRQVHELVRKAGRAVALFLVAVGDAEEITADDGEGRK
jgi:hypothetical protein